MDTFEAMAPLRNIKRSHLFLLTCMLFFFVQQSAAQVETLESLANSESTIMSSHSFQNGTEIVLIRQQWRYKFWKINKNTGSATLLDSISDFSSNNKILQSESGLFYLTSVYMPNGNDLRYYINHIDTNGVKSVSPFNSIQYASNSNDYAPKLLAYHHGELLFIKHNHQDGKDHLAKDNNTLTAHTLVHSFAEPFQTSFVANDSLLIVTKASGFYEFYNYSPTGMSYRFGIPATASQMSIGLAGEKDNEAFFNVYRAAGHNQLWKTDYTYAGTSVYIDSLYVSSIQFEGNSFMLRDGYANTFWKGDYDHPEDRTKVPFASNMDPQETYLDIDLPSNHFRLLSHQYGIELGKFENDTIKLTGDLFPGIGTGLPGKQTSLNSMHTFPYITSARGNDSLFAIMTNGNDSLRYLYMYDGTGFKSYFPISNPGELVWMRTSDTDVFWLRNNSQGMTLQRRSLVSALEPQPLVSIWPDSSLVWTTHLGYNSKNHNIWGSEFNPDYNTGCKLMPDGGVITCFNLRDFEERFVFTTEGYVSDSLNSCVIFCKYDKFGHVSWTRSLGGIYTTFLELPSFAIDSEGNILVAGPAFEKAYFGTDLITTPRSLNYLAKINGETGQIMWKKVISETYYSDDIIIENITLDASNSIYLSIYFRGFNCNVDGETVQAELSPSNAVAKFSADGNIEQLLGTPTPWTDYGGRTKVFLYNDETQEIISAQTQGFYNYSSTCKYRDWDYFMQVMDTNGNIKRQKSFISNDLGSLTTATIQGKNLLGFGYFRATMDIGLFSETTAPTSSCFTDESFMYTYLSETNEIIAFKTSISEPFYPLDSKSFGDNTYVYGTDKNNELVIIRFSASGEETGYLRLGQKSDPFDWGNDQFFDVNDEYLVFFGSLFKANPTYDVFPVFEFCPYKTVIKTRNEGWKTDIKWFEDELMIPFESNGDADVVAFPNPFHDHITLSFPNPGFGYDRYELSDLNGKLVGSGKLSDQVLQTLPFNGLVRGSYLLRILSDEEERIIKLIKF